METFVLVLMLTASSPHGEHTRTVPNLTAAQCQQLKASAERAAQRYPGQLESATCVRVWK